MPVPLALAMIGALCSLAAATQWTEQWTEPALAGVHEPRPRQNVERPASVPPLPDEPPARAAAVEVEEASATRAATSGCAPDTLTFEPSGARPTAVANQRLHMLGAWLAEHPDARATVDGHADALGDPELNLTLSQRRARAVRTLLVAAGAQAEQLALRWFGAFAPLDEHRAEGAENRRVVIRVLGDTCPPLAVEPAAP